MMNIEELSKYQKIKNLINGLILQADKQIKTIEIYGKEGKYKEIKFYIALETIEELREYIKD